MAYLQISRRLEEKYRIKILCSDAYPVYAKYRIAENHAITKAETSLVESKNSLIRHYLARFNRKTKRYTKSIEMIYHSLVLLFNRKEIENIII